MNVFFSEPLRADTATNLANYTLNGPGGSVAISAAALDASGTMVTLATSPLMSGSGYTLVVGGVRDGSSAGNLIVPGSQASFLVTSYVLRDIGAPAVTGGFLLASNGIALVACGAGIGGTADQFSLASQTVTGDFDVQLRLAALGLSDPWAVAGLMARDGLATNTVFAASLATPGPAGCLFESRTNVGAAAAQAGFFPVNYPYTWLRLRREGSVFTGYASLDGQTWSLLGSVTITASNVLQVGIAVSSHNPAQTTSATFADTGTTLNPIVADVPLPLEPLGPSSRHTGLVISEIMYHPQNPGASSLEFVEIYNSDLIYEDVSGYRLSGSINYTFPPGTLLPSGGYLVVAREPAAVQAYYGITGVQGPFTNNLPNGSGIVQLLNELGSILMEVDYSSSPPWPVAADEAGHSLVLRRPSYGENNPQAWGISDVIGGSPGRGDGYGNEPLRSVVINEILAHTDPPDLDSIELFNRGSQPLNLGGCIVTDDFTTNKFIIPANTTIAARGFVGFTESQLGFRLNAAGETIYLKNPAQTRVLDALQFDAQEHGVSFGRWPDGSDQWYRLNAKTFGSPNAAPIISQVGINEIMYKPLSGLDDDQYVELYNSGTNAVNLGGWQFVSGISFTFAANTIIPAGGYLVVAANVARMLANYPNLNTTNTAGNFTGSLAHHGERLALARPDTLISTNGSGVASTNLVAIVVDEVTYGTGGRWGQWSDGGGSSLELIDPRSDKRFAANWADSDETAKAPWTLIQRTDLIDLGMSTSGNGAPNRFEFLLQDAGECLVDDMEVDSNGGTNWLVNPSFESGADGWAFQGTHNRTTVETGQAFSGTQFLHVRATSGGDTGANRIRTADFSSNLAVSGTNQATLRARVRWLKGSTNILLRIRGNWLECAGGMTVPANLGTPGAPNSRLVTNAGPAIADLTHWPILPAAGEPVVVSARVADPDGVSGVTLRYRIDPATSYTTLNMRDDGTGGDAFANDGIYSATIPGQAASTRAAFYVQAQDAHAPAATTIFPADAPTRECLVNFGETLQPGSLGSYRLWLTQSNINYWNTREKNSNDGIDATFVYGNWRVIYDAQTEYSGSPFHTPGYNGPLGSAVCNYLMKFPPDDVFLGNTDFLLEGQGSTDGSIFSNDASAQAETTAHWMGRKIGIRPDYRRHVLVYLNGQKRGVVYWDYQKPRGELVKEFFPADSDGHLVKIDDWFEFDDAGSGQSIITARLLEYNLNGQKRTERYRWNWLPDGGSPPNDFADLYDLVDAVNAPGPEPYTSATLNLVNIRQWMRMFALQHMAGNWDSYGYRRGKNMFAYKPTAGPWELMLYDIQLVFGKSSDGPSQPLFDLGTSGATDQYEPSIYRMYNHPPFMREFWAAMQDLVNGPMQPENYGPLMDARVAALHANGVAIADPSSIKTWIATRRAFILPQIPQATFFVDGPNSLNSASNSVTLTGLAPIGAEKIVVNGVSYPLTWTTVTNWSLRVQLNAPANALTVQALDANGNVISNGTSTLTVNYSGAPVAPMGNVVFNEIMHHPPLPGAEYVELFNTHSNCTFDLSNWNIHGLGYTFPPGSLLLPRSFLVLAKDRYAYLIAYGATNAVFDEFSGMLDPDGETLSLIQPGTPPLTNVVVAEVRYETNAPWPAGAIQPGTSLQLVDPAEDNWRVANWAIGQTNPPPPIPQWVHVAATGAATSSMLYVYLQSAGDVHVDDIKLVAGSVPEAGANTLSDGDFESGFPGPWTVSANHSGSTLSTTTKHSGNASLHVIATSGGTTQGSSIWQIISPALTTNASYTLSFWYLQSTNGGPLTVRLSGSGIVATVSPAPPAAGPSLAFTPGTANSVATNLPPFPPVLLNELQANNVTGPLDNNNQHDPWVELYNNSTNTFSLAGYYLTDTYTNLTKWAFPTNAVVSSNGFTLVWCDNQTNQNAASSIHAAFALASGSGSVALIRVVSNAVQIVDYLNYKNLPANWSYGDIPDGQPFYRGNMFYATPGGTNSGAAAPIEIYVNEWMADNKHTLGNPLNGAFDDWFELYNPGTNDVDLGGYYLTDTLTDKTKFQIPNNGHYLVPARGYFVVWADNNNSQNSASRPELHVNFALSKSGEAIGLFSSDGTAIDAITFGAQTSDVCQGRFPDGAASIYFMPTPTPGAANVIPNTAPGLATITNRVVTLGQTLSFTASATDTDQPPQALTFTLTNAPAGAQIGAASGLFAWTPVAAPATNNIGVIVTDNGAPNLNAMQSFTVVVAPVPVTTGCRMNGKEFIFNWSAFAGQQFQVEFKDDLNQAGWIPLGNALTGSGGVLLFTNVPDESTQRFFRLRVLP